MQKPPTKKKPKTNRNRSSRSDFFIPHPGYLSLDDGSIWEGIRTDDRATPCVGEVVFNTGMTGYIESLTDPSYAGQILVFTYPLIGNYGVDIKAVESDAIQVSGVIVSEAVSNWSHPQSKISLAEWLQTQNIPLLSGIDTRSLTKHLRVSGTKPGMISTEPNNTGEIKLEKKFVSIPKPITYNPTAAKTVVLVDCGAKENILRSLLKLPVRVKRVPHDYDYTGEVYDAVLLSNGPGDPADYRAAVEITRKALLGNKPVFGICLGSQIMGLAAGARTYKLKFGHRGHNQPCIEQGTDRAFITSQNHGYAVEESSLPKDWEVTFRNLNDDSVEGVQHKTKPFFSVQFHPEACPGPTDTEWLFERFHKSL